MRYPQHDQTLHPNKGDFHEECNVTACRNKDATWYNRFTLGYYCEFHARAINKGCESSDMEPLCAERKIEE